MCVNPQENFNKYFNRILENHTHGAWCNSLVLWFLELELSFDYWSGWGGGVECCTVPHKKCRKKVFVSLEILYIYLPGERYT